MDAAGLLLGVVVPSALLLPGEEHIVALGLAVAVVLVLAGGSFYWRRWRRRRAAMSASTAAPALALKERLRRRLAEPPEAFAPFAGAGPTVGACEVVEGDFDSVAERILPEAGWRRGVAKHALRRTLNGDAPPGEAAASEAARWRQLGALELLDDVNAALAAYARAAALCPEDADLQLLVGVLYLRTGRLEVAEAIFRRQLERARATENGETVADGRDDADTAPDAKPPVASGAKDEAEDDTEDVPGAKDDAAPAPEGNGGAAEPAECEGRAAAAPAAKGNAEAIRRGAIRFRARTMLGDVMLAKGEREAALAAYEAARDEVVALSDREPENPRWRRDASVAHDRLGDVLLAGGQVEPALECFRLSLGLCKALAEEDPANPHRQHDLSVAHDRVGEALALCGDLDGALESYRQGLARAEAAAGLAPACAEWRWDVSASHDRIGDALAEKGRQSDALAAYRLGLEIAQALAGAGPPRLDWQRDLAVSCHKVGLLEAQLGHHAEAREALEQGRAIIARLAEAARYQAQWQADLARFNAALKVLEP